MPNFSGIWTNAQQLQATGQGIWPAAPGAPTIGTAASASATSVSVPFTAPTCTGKYPAGVASYTATSTPGCFTASGASSPLTVTGLTTGTSYTFKVKAIGSNGLTSACSAASNSVAPVAVGQDAYTTAGSYSWVAPAGVTSVSVVAVGSGAGGGGNGGGGGGALGYKNNYTVVPGNSYTVVVGAAGTFGNAGSDSYFISTSVVKGGGGLFASGCRSTYTGDGGGQGGASVGGSKASGGGAGGYSGNGGNYVPANCYPSVTNGNSGTGGGGASGSAGGNGASQEVSGGGGGVGILGQGSNGVGGGTSKPPPGGGGGSGGANGTAADNSSSVGGYGGAYGGGGGSGYGGLTTGGVGAVRIIWPGTTRSFPSTNTGNL